MTLAPAAQLRWTSAGAAAVGLFAVLLLAGCGGSRIPTQERGETLRSQGEGDHLAQALVFLGGLDEFDPGQAHRQMLYHLNEWVRHEPIDRDWIADPMAARVPPELANQTTIEGLKSQRFIQYDTLFLEETVWLRDLAKWIPQDGPPADPKLLAWLKEQSPQLGAEGADDLAAAERIFDWTVRNVQLDADPATADKQPPDEAKDSAERKDADKDAAGKPSDPPIVAPPGARYWPSEALLMGHGDALVRARVFIGICRQRGIDAVALAVQDDATSATRPWAVGVLVAKQLYLFDPWLGLPIPGPGGRGIATLDQAQTDETLLRALDLSETERYPFTAADVRGTVALIEANAPHLTMRMKLLEAHLAGDNRLTLTVQPSEFAARLRQAKGLANVRLWTVPFQANLFKQQFAENRAAYIAAAKQEQAFVGLHPLTQGRRRHFRGQFQNQDVTAGAKPLYNSCRTSDELIDAIGKSEEARQAIGLDRVIASNPELASNSTLRAEFIADRQRIMREMKLLGTYFLGLACFDSGEYEVAANHMEKRVLGDFPDNRYAAGARYNLARAWEALGENAKAQAIYEGDDSPQRYGNLLRAKRLAPM